MSYFPPKKTKSVITIYSLLATDENINTSSTTAFALTLYLATGTGREHIITNTNTGIVTLTCAGSDIFNITGVTTVPLNQGESVHISDVASGIWFVTA